jgi:hypothetical protein
MNKKNLIVNLAASHVSISAFRTEGNKLVFEKSILEDLPPLLNDDDWLIAATSAVSLFGPK